MILGFASPSEGYVGHKGYFTFVAVLAIIITTLFLIFALINVQAVCCPARWLVVVSQQRNFDVHAENIRLGNVLVFIHFDTLSHCWYCRCNCCETGSNFRGSSSKFFFKN